MNMEGTLICERDEAFPWLCSGSGGRFVNIYRSIQTYIWWSATLRRVDNASLALADEAFCSD